MTGDALTAATRAMCAVLYGPNFDLHEHGAVDPEGRDSLEAAAEAAIDAYLEEVAAAKGTFPCAVDVCPLEFADRAAHNRHSHAMHTQAAPGGGLRYPGVDAAGNFRWFPA